MDGKAVIPPYLVLHNDHGGPKECNGIILPKPTGEHVVLSCTECDGNIGTANTIDDAHAILLRMALNEAICTETCPHCNQPNIFPGVPAMIIYTCRHCDQPVQVRHAA